MFSIQKEFSKKVVALLSGKEATRVGKYKVPQFGPNPEKAKDVKYTDEEVMSALQEMVNYFGTDGIIRYINWSLIVAAQRKSNNDLRTAAAGLDAASQARVTLVMNIAKRAAEAEVGVFDDKGEMTINRKSDEYLAALKDSITASLARPKFADLRPVFEGAEGGELEFDLTVPGSLGDAPPAVEEKETEEPPAA